MENKIEYKIINANHKMIDKISEIFWNNPKLIEKRYDYRINTAVDAERNILGYISTADKESLYASGINCRFIHLLKVIPEYRHIRRTET